MVLVRKSELACRNGWDQDLWEVAGASAGAQPSSQYVDLTVAGGADLEIPDPDTIESEPAVAAHASAREMFTDKLTAISMPVRSQLSRDAGDEDAADDEARRDGFRDSRTAVREARRRRQEQRSQDRQRHHEQASEEAQRLLDSGSDDDRPESKRGGEPQRASSAQRESRVPGGRVSPVTDRVERPAAKSDNSAARRRAEPRSFAASIEFSAQPARFGEALPASSDPPQSTREHREQQGEAVDRGERAGGQQTEPLPAEDVRTAIAATGRMSPGRKQQDLIGPLRSMSIDDLPDDFPPPVEPRRHRWITGAGPVGRRETQSPGAGSRVVLPLALTVDPLDEATASGAVPRCCGTCRDFKQVGDGRKGWCGNPHAFPERRMVQSDELACGSSIGTWWLPNDDLWLERVDTTHHGRPTPLLDELVRPRKTDKQGMGSRSS